MKMKELHDVSEEWAMEVINSKVDIIKLVEDEYGALKLALALGLCQWRYVCGRGDCFGRVSLVHRRGYRNLWWKCCRHSCGAWTSTFDGSLFGGIRTSWKDLIIVLWEISYDARITSAHIAMVCNVVVVFSGCLVCIGISF
jgi:hypothetical protein